MDATLGLGGHTERLLEASAPDGRVVGLDRDPAALALARARLAWAGDRLQAVAASFEDLAEVAGRLGLDAVDGRPLRPRGVLAAARRRRPRLQLPGRRPPGHADGPHHRDHRGRGGRHLPTGRPRPHPARVRRGALRGPHRPRDRRGTTPWPHRHHRPAGRAGQGGGARSRPADRSPPGPPGLPGPAHRGQPGAGRAPGLPAAGHRPARPRRAAGRARLPLPRGPHRQAGPGRRGRPPGRRAPPPPGRPARRRGGDAWPS